MSSVEIYQKILPDWTALRALEESEVEAIAELIVALALVGGVDAEPSAYAELKVAWMELFCEADWVAHASFAAHLDGCEFRIRRLFAHPRAFGILLVSACSRLRAPTTQFHALCLAIVTTFCSGANQEQTDLVYRIGHKLNVSTGRIDELFTRMRASLNTAPPKRSAEQPGPLAPHREMRSTAKLSTDSIDSPRP
ncbi:hypothetical protein [Bradymonas sediminis]|uniref:Uncharacterized protein n=1 Tax=Bradymonas sediminis TaxID=1548548 RepID=A0A2Z4FJB9_9DELT|nr:hypothetical protein [Bradymonas sediminis]AWV89117.1 hypothetical protein DN745_07120 [Bradymonas sediminis]TDP64417.1 hypothetical protein DFR33_10978 [Bradymonas sediminis]